MSVQQTAVVGAGTMGNGIAHVFALHGYTVTLIDLDEELLDDAHTTIERNLSRQVDKDVIGTHEKAAALDRLALTTNTADGVCSADLVVEAVPEEQDVKTEVFGTVDEHAPAEGFFTYE